MKKLLELLNEFRPTISCVNFKEHYEFIDDDIYLIRKWMDGEEEHFPMYVCYKKGDFVKWLVENDKIDESKIFCDQWLYYSLLCKLAISDTPIEDLISSLK